MAPILELVVLCIASSNAPSCSLASSVASAHRIGGERDCCVLFIHSADKKCCVWRTTQRGDAASAFLLWGLQGGGGGVGALVQLGRGNRQSLLPYYLGSQTNGV